MTNYKITITANANWFIVRLGNNASWVLPKDQWISYTSQGTETKSDFRLSAKELMCEASSITFH